MNSFNAVRSNLIQPGYVQCRQVIDFSGGPRRIRTPDPLIRSQVLYPAELSVRESGI